MNLARALYAEELSLKRVSCFKNLKYVYKGCPLMTEASKGRFTCTLFLGLADPVPMDAHEQHTDLRGPLREVVQILHSRYNAPSVVLERSA